MRYLTAQGFGDDNETVLNLPDTPNLDSTEKDHIGIYESSMYPEREDVTNYEIIEENTTHKMNYKKQVTGEKAAKTVYNFHEQLIGSFGHHKGEQIEKRKMVIAKQK